MLRLLSVKLFQESATFASVPSSVTTMPSKLDGGQAGQLAVEQGAAAGVGDVDSLRAGEARQTAQIERAAVGGIEPQGACWVTLVRAETSSTLPAPSAWKVLKFESRLVKSRSANEPPFETYTLEPSTSVRPGRR